MAKDPDPAARTRNARPRRWSAGRAEYSCADDVHVAVPNSTRSEAAEKERAIPRNGIQYQPC